MYRVSLTIGFLLCGIALGSVSEGDKFYNAGKWTKARDAYQNALPELTGEERGRVLSRIGYTYQRDGKLKESINAYLQALATQGIHPYEASYAQLQLGTAYAQVREAEKAVAAYRKVPLIEGANPNNVVQSYTTGSSQLLKLGREEEAVAALEKVADVKGAAAYYLPDAFMRLGRIHERARRYDAAIVAYQKVVESPGVIKHQRIYAEHFITELNLLKQGELPFYILPYLVHVDQTAGRMHWVTQSQQGDVSPGKVTLSSAGKTQELNSTVQAIERGTICYLHTVELTGLQPGTRYTYEVTCEDQIRKGSFTTTADEGYTGRVTFGVTGDTQTESELHRSVAIPMAAEKPDFVIHVGDLTDRGSIWGKWRAEFFDPGSSYMMRGGIVPAVGNHDGGAFFPLLFDQSKRMYYTFTHGNVQVFVLDSYWHGASRRAGRPAQLKWLREQLAASKATWKFVALHVPMIASDHRNPWFGEDDFLPLLQEFGVDLVLSGHHPMYRKYLPIGNDNAKPIIHVTTGGGGPVGDPVPSPLMHVGAGLVHYSMITVEGNRLELVAREPDGSVIDRFELIKTNGRYQDEVMRKSVDPKLAKRIRHVYQDLLKDRSGELLVDINGPLRPGIRGQIVVDTDHLPGGRMDVMKLPTGLELLLSPMQSSAWRMSEQAQLFVKRRLEYDVTPPMNLTVGAGSLSPPLHVMVNVRLGDRRFEPVQAQVALGPNAMMQMASAAGGLPVMWDFRLDPKRIGDKEKWYDPATPTESWRKLAITGWWEKLLDREYDGIAWYRTSVNAPKVKSDERLWLEFGAIDESCRVYANGRLVGEQIFDTHKDDSAWEKPRRFDVTPYAVDGENVFVVRVQDLFGMGGIYQGAILKTAPANLIPNRAFGDGPEHWSSDVTNPVVRLTTANGKYVDEQCLLVDKTNTDDVQLHRTVQVNTAPGAYEISLRYRQQLPGQESRGGRSITIELFRGKAADPIHTLSVAPDTSRRWQTSTGRFVLPVGQNAKDVRIRVTLRHAGRYELDELSITPVR